MSRTLHTTGVASAEDADTVIQRVVDQCDFVLTSYGKTGRQSRAIDQVVDRFWSKRANITNNARRAAAVAAGQDKFTRATAYDAMRGVYQKLPEFALEDMAVLEHSTKILQTAKEPRLFDLPDAKKLVDAMVERYVNHPDAQQYISLDQLEDEQLDEFDETLHAKEITA